MTGLDTTEVRGWIAAFAAGFREMRGALDEMDRQAGDGDFGGNLLPAFDAAGAGEDGISDTFAALARGFMQVGGTSGPLFGVWFREFARASAGADQLAAESLAAAAQNGLLAVQRLGNAEVGDKTMVDAMVPAAAALQREADAGAGARAAVAAAATDSRIAAEGTAAMTARRGRASYVGEAARGTRDPGAVAVALFFEALAAAPEN